MNMTTTRTLNLLATALVGGLAMNDLATQALQHVPTAMNRDSQDTPEVRV
jgi:hypothetical protein